jgi:3-hydroxyacyl-CoA dehydrogenase
MPNQEAFFQFARNMVKGVAGPFPAPFKCIDAVQTAVTKPFDEGMKIERSYFIELMGTPESRALRHAVHRRARRLARSPTCPTTRRRARSPRSA